MQSNATTVGIVTTKAIDEGRTEVAIAVAVAVAAETVAVVRVPATAGTNPGTGTTAAQSVQSGLIDCEATARRVQA